MPIEFRCHQCQHTQKVDESKIGQQIYCKVCYLKLTVPAESTVKPIDESQLYATDAVPLDAREMQNRHEFISLRCDICKTNIAVREEQVGQKIVCPECDTKIIVPKSIAEKAETRRQDKLAKEMISTAQVSLKDTYSLRDGSDALTVDWSKRFRFLCQLCSTPLSATDEQVGTLVTCPDCETKTKVPPRPKKIDTSPLQPMSFEGDTVFGVATPSPPPLPQSATGPPVITPPPVLSPSVSPPVSAPVSSKENLVPVVCSLCQTRMYAKESQIGKFKNCPDCGRQTEIKAVPKHQMTTAEAISTDGYGVNETDASAPRPTFRTLTDYRYVDGSLDKALYAERYSGGNQDNSQTDESRLDPSYSIDAEALRERRERRNQSNRGKKRVSRMSLDRPKLPARPLTERFFVPFFHPGTWVRMIIFVAVGLFGAVFFFSLSDVTIFSTIFTGPFTLVMYVTAYCWFSTLLIQFFGITSSGMDEVEFEGELSPFDYFLNGFWLLSYSIVTAALGFLVVNATAGPDSLPSPVVLFVMMRISHWLFFPICFLSSMESGSMFAPLAKHTLLSLFRQPFAWIRFYLLSGIIFVCSDVCFNMAGMWFDSLERGELIVFYIVLLTCFFCWFAVQSMFYFRLLGRLAWLLEETERQRRELEEED